MNVNEHAWKTLTKLEEITDIFENIDEIRTGDDDPGNYFIRGDIKVGADATLNFTQTDNNVYHVTDFANGLLQQIRSFYGLNLDYCIGYKKANCDYVFSHKIRELTDNEANDGVEIWQE